MTPELIAGYRAFRGGSFATQEALYRKLTAEGQSPDTMVIGCCDSRVDPATIFDAGPGRLFVVRNVANLVPPCQANDDNHGTSAALEFAVKGLGVAHILVLGHARCGGIAALIEDRYKTAESGSFIPRWMSIMQEAREQVLRDLADRSEPERQTALELASIVRSLANLETFPFIAERLAAGTLSLHGGYFDITTGVLLALDRGSGRFTPVT
jgi:carbonic anhydrase